MATLQQFDLEQAGYSARFAAALAQAHAYLDSGIYYFTATEAAAEDHDVSLPELQRALTKGE